MSEESDNRTTGGRSAVVGRDVINSIIATGDHNQFFIHGYERLRDAYIEPWQVFERVDLVHAGKGTVFGNGKYGVRPGT